MCFLNMKIMSRRSIADSVNNESAYIPFSMIVFCCFFFIKKENKGVIIDLA